MHALLHLRRVFIAIVVLALIGMTGFHAIEGWTWFDSLYMVLTTFTTIGYQEVHPLSHSGRVFNIFMIVAGVCLLFLLIGVLTQALLEFELRDFFGRRRMEREISRLKDHYIICGAGRVGRSVARELALKPAPFVIIDNNPEKMLKYADEQWLTIIGDATQEAALRQARIEHAAGLVAATTTDATNIYIVLTARGLSDKIKIIARASEEYAAKHLKSVGADSIVSPYIFAGHRIAQTFLRPHVLDFLDSATVQLGVPLEIAQVHISEGSSYVGQTLAASKIRHDPGIIVLAIKRGEDMHVNPSKDDVMHANDYLIAMGEPTKLRTFEERAVVKVRA
jgi:voltage-gated potassium channel